MTDIDLAPDNELQPTDCISYRLRRAARVVARFYDHALRPSGLRNTQFTLLAALDKVAETSIGELSESLAVDGTTLTRNLEILVRRGLVENTGADDGRVRMLRLTALGHETFDKAVPLWREAQRQLLDTVEPGRWSGMRSALHRIEIACNGAD